MPTYRVGLKYTMEYYGELLIEADSPDAAERAAEQQIDQTFTPGFEQFEVLVIDTGAPQLMAESLEIDRVEEAQDGEAHDL